MDPAFGERPMRLLRIPRGRISAAFATGKVSSFRSRSAGQLMAAKKKLYLLLQWRAAMGSLKCLRGKRGREEEGKVPDDGSDDEYPSSLSMLVRMDAS